MKQIKQWRQLSALLLFLSSMALLSAGPAFSAANQADCSALATYVAGLTDETLHQPIISVTATWNAATATAPEYCAVSGRIFPETDFSVQLPTAWNQRLIHFGGGGWDGSVPKADTTSLNLGYAGSGSNGGHSAANDAGGTFGLKDPYYREFFPQLNRDNPYACQKIVDFGNRALRETPVLAKKIIQKYYGSTPQRSYYSGRSTGGREGFVVAQKSYDLFDGYFIGSPVSTQGGVSLRGAWDTFQGNAFTTKPGTVPPSPRDLFANKAVALHDAVYGKCDGIDGLVDGVIDDPRKCSFDPLTELPACPGDVDAAGCFTLAQRQALKEIYKGPHDSKGKALYVGTPLSAEYLTDPTKGTSSGFNDALIDDRGPDIFKYWADPPPGPTWGVADFNWDTDPGKANKYKCTQCYDGKCKTYTITKEEDAFTVNSTLAPNMGGFAPLQKKGSKIVHYDGWSDSLVSPLTSVTLYETALKQMGVDKTKSFWKMYMIPGMGHGLGSGISAAMTWTDGFNAMVKWVENGVEPGAILGSRKANAAWGWPAKTRPLCPYPEVARYSGAGSADDAANFMCVPPMDVKFAPATVNLKSKGVLTASITIPNEYNMKDWDPRNVTLEGVSAKSGSANGRTYTAKFNIKDLQSLTAGNSVTLTVKGLFHKDGKDALVQASNTVKVTK